MAIFKNQPSKELDQQAISTIISEGCIIDGNIKATAFARIDGQINGDVIVDEGLILGEKGSIKGKVNTRQMVVYGTITGNIDAEQLEIRNSGRITGDIKTQSLQIESGAVYNGNLTMPQ